MRRSRRSGPRSSPRLPRRPAARCGHDAEDTRMNLSALLPAGIDVSTAMAICAVALVAGTARGFSGFGAALIFMPLASSFAAPRLVAALLLIIDFVAAAPLLPSAWKHGDRKATWV